MGWSIRLSGGTEGANSQAEQELVQGIFEGLVKRLTIAGLNPLDGRADGPLGGLAASDIEVKPSDQKMVRDESNRNQIETMPSATGAKHAPLSKNEQKVHDDRAKKLADDDKDQRKQMEDTAKATDKAAEKARKDRNEPEPTKEDKAREQVRKDLAETRGEPNAEQATILNATDTTPQTEPDHMLQERGADGLGTVVNVVTGEETIDTGHAVHQKVAQADKPGKAVR